MGQSFTTLNKHKEKRKLITGENCTLINVIVLYVINSFLSLHTMEK